MTDISDLTAEIAYMAKTLDGNLHAVVSVSKAHSKVIVNARAKTGPAGVLYELDWTRVVSYDTDSDALGLLVLEALTQYRIEQRYLADLNASDWPSYKASGLRSMRRFQESFVRVEVEAWPNRMVHLIGHPPGPGEIDVRATLGFPNPAPLGDRIFHLALCCTTLREAGLASS